MAAESAPFSSRLTAAQHATDSGVRIVDGTSIRRRPGGSGAPGWN
jgi:hypothetical protein